MLRKIASLISLFVLFAWLSPVSAAKPNYAPEFPDQSGTYDVPGHPNLKVKVFVHKANPGKPGPAPAPSCDDPDVNDVVGATGWHIEGARTYKVNLVGPSTISSSIPSIVYASVNEWLNRTDLKSKISFVQDGTTAINRATFDGQNIIAWGRTSGSALGITYTWYDRDSGISAESDTIMNVKFPWSWNACTTGATYDAQNILTHELGHWFGLNDHYTASYRDNTMFGYGSKNEIKKNTLTNGDISGINAIY